MTIALQVIRAAPLCYMHEPSHGGGTRVSDLRIRPGDALSAGPYKTAGGLIPRLIHGLIAKYHQGRLSFLH